MLNPVTFDAALNAAALRPVDYLTRLDTAPSNHRFGIWHDVLSDAFYPFDLSTPKPEFEIGDLVIKDAGPVRAGLVRSDPITVERRRRHLCAPGGDYIYIPIPVNTSVTIEQNGSRASVCPGDLAFVVTAECYRYEQPRKTDQLTLRIPAALMRDRFPGIENLSARKLSRNRAPVALFMDFATSFCANATSLEEQSATTAANYLLDLFCFALTAGEEVETNGDTSVKIAHCRRAIRYIDAHLYDPELGVRRVAHAANVSERYLQRLFAERDETVTGFIRNRRIREAKRLLRDPAARPHSIASIAYRVGFADPSHFSRLFREATGVCPRDFRGGAC